MANVKKRWGTIVILGMMPLFIFGCVYGGGLTYTEAGALLGAVYGAGLGAAIGSVDGYVGEGAGIGGLVGSLIGGAIGYAIEGNTRYDYRDTYDYPYYRNPYSSDPYYRDYGYTRPQYGPYNPSYTVENDRPTTDTYRTYDYDSSGTSGTVYLEDTTKPQKRRVMSPGYETR